MTSNFILHLGKDHWQWKQRDRGQELLADAQNLTDWTAVSRFPSEIHVELLEAGKIPHPHIGFNEHKALCMYLVVEALDVQLNLGLQGLLMKSGYTSLLFLLTTLLSIPMGPWYLKGWMPYATFTW